NENLGRMHGIDPAVADGAILELEPVEPRPLFHHHPATFLVPEGLTVADAYNVLAQLERPSRVEPRAGPGIEPRRLHDLRSHDPLRSPFSIEGFFLVRPLPSDLCPPLFRLLPPKQHRSRKQHDLPIVSRLVEAALLVERRDVAQ